MEGSSVAWSAGRKPGGPPGPPNAGLPKLWTSAGLVWEGTCFVLLRQWQAVLLRVGMLVLLPNLGSSWSYKLHASLHPVAGLPCPREIRDHPDCASVAAHNWKSLCLAVFHSDPGKKRPEENKGEPLLRPREVPSDSY